MPTTSIASWCKRPPAILASQRRPASPGVLGSSAAAGSPGANPKASMTFPLAVSHSQVRRAINVRNLERQRAAGQRQGIRGQMHAEFRQQPVDARDLCGCINEPGEPRRKLHGPIMGLTQLPYRWLLSPGLALALPSAQLRSRKLQ
jgi:hypothetical protein